MPDGPTDPANPPVCSVCGTFHPAGSPCPTKPNEGGGGEGNETGG